MRGGGEIFGKKDSQAGLCNKKIQEGSQEEKKPGPGLLKQRKGRVEGFQKSKRKKENQCIRGLEYDRYL